MGRTAKYTDAEAIIAFASATEHYDHIPTAREYAKYLHVSVRTAWALMVRLQLRKTCDSCKGTGWDLAL